MATQKLVAASHPPSVGVAAGATAGVVTGVICSGATSLVARDGTGTGAILFSVAVTRACTVPLNVTFTKGLHITQNTPSDVSLTYA